MTGLQVEMACETANRHSAACSVLQPSLIGPDGAEVQWRFSNDSDTFDGLIAEGPAVAVSTDAANPLGPKAPDGAQCQPTSEFGSARWTRDRVCGPTTV